MAIRRFVVPVTVDAAGDAEVFSPVLSGQVISVRYVKDDFANGVDVAITVEGSGATVWAEENVNASTSRYPRTGLHSTTGAAALYADTGTAVNGRISVSQDRLKLVIAAGGNETSGTFHITIDG